MDDSIPNPDDLENNKFDFVESGTGANEPAAPFSSDPQKAGSGFTEKLGGAEGSTGTTASQEREGKTIKVPKAEADRFRLQHVWNEAFSRFLEVDGSTEVLEASMSQNPDEYLRDKDETLTPESRFFLQMTVEKRKPSQNPPAGQGTEEVTLQGDEAEKYEVYHSLEGFDKTFDQYAESGDPLIDEVLRVTTQSDPSKVAEFIVNNKDRLTPLALNFLTSSLRIKTSV